MRGGPKGHGLPRALPQRGAKRPLPPVCQACPVPCVALPRRQLVPSGYPFRRGGCCWKSLGGSCGALSLDVVPPCLAVFSVFLMTRPPVPSLLLVWGWEGPCVSPSPSSPLARFCTGSWAVS